MSEAVCTCALGWLKSASVPLFATTEVAFCVRVSLNATATEPGPVHRQSRSVKNSALVRCPGQYSIRIKQVPGTVPIMRPRGPRGPRSLRNLNVARIFVLGCTSPEICDRIRPPPSRQISKMEEYTSGHELIRPFNHTRSGEDEIHNLFTRV